MPVHVLSVCVCVYACTFTCVEACTYFLYVAYVGGAVKNDELDISWQNSLFYIFRRITSRSKFPPRFKIILYYCVTICDVFCLYTYFGQNSHFGIHYLYYRDTLQYI